MIENLPRAFYNIGNIQIHQMRMLKPLQQKISDDIAANRSTEAKLVRFYHNS